MSDEIKALVRRGFVEGVNRRDLHVFDDFIGDGYRNHNMPAPAPGPQGLKQVVGMFLEAFPDMQISIDQLIAEGDSVATRGSWTGTHRGTFMGLPATGKQVQVQYLDMWRFEDGKAVENWVQMDMLGLMQQVGALPAP